MKKLSTYVALKNTDLESQHFQQLIRIYFRPLLLSGPDTGVTDWSSVVGAPTPSPFPLSGTGCADNGRGVFKEKEGNVLFNDVLNTFYLRLYGVRHMIKDHSDSEKGNLLPPHRLLLSINKGSFICTILQTG